MFLDVLAGSVPEGAASRAILARARREGGLVVGEVVYAELAATFLGDTGRLAAFLDDASARLERSSETALIHAGSLWRRYRKAGGPRTRLLADFLVGAHAMHHADRLLTRDDGFWRTHFATLPLLEVPTPP